MTQNWNWTYADTDGRPLAGLGTGGFPTQGEAEAYLSESWAELAEAGVTAVTLTRDGQVIYGPMSLEAS